MLEDAVEKMPMDQLAQQIGEYAKQTDDRTIKAAALVLEARERVAAGDAGKISWTRWARINLKLSQTRLRELQRIAKADDPHRELVRLRSEGARRGKEYRERRKAALPNGGAPQDRLEYVKLNADGPDSIATTPETSMQTGG